MLWPEHRIFRERQKWQLFLKAGVGLVLPCSDSAAAWVAIFVVEKFRVNDHHNVGVQYE